MMCSPVSLSRAVVSSSTYGLVEIPTFLLAGHETTSTGLTWTLWALSQRPDIQVRLRKELRSLPLPTGARDSSTLSQEEVSALDKLPLLDAVVRETMRIHAPVTGTSRVAVKDDVIPVGRPYRDRNGVVQDTIRVTKGDFIPIPIMPVNRSPEIWGEDAHEWKSVSLAAYHTHHADEIFSAAPTVG
jgi:cytochrome P450